MSNDFYKAIPFETLYYEYINLRKEKQDFLEAVQANSISKDNLQDVQSYMKKLDEKKKTIESRIREYYFPKYNIIFRSFQKALEQLLQQHLGKEENKRLKSDIKSFDPKDAKVY